MSGQKGYTLRNTDTVQLPHLDGIFVSLRGWLVFVFVPIFFFYFFFWWESFKGRGQIRDEEMSGIQKHDVKFTMNK